MCVPHLLVDGTEAILIDTGLPVDAFAIRRTMAKANMGSANLRAILLTHGHLDHAGNAAALHEATGAPVYAHPLEQPHLEGVFPYRGPSRICGGLEAFGRTLMRYRPARINIPLADGDELPFWGGLRVVHLPGHTLGHCGFYSARHDLLFSGDLWVRFLMRTRISPPIFTAAPECLPASLQRARSLGARRVVPGHYTLADAARLRRSFEELCAESERRVPVV